MIQRKALFYCIESIYFVTDCDGSESVRPSKEPERIIIDRDQVIDNDPTTHTPPRYPRPPDPSDAPPKYTEQRNNEGAAQDSMYRTSAATGSHKNSFWGLVAVILAQITHTNLFYIKRFCCR